MRLRTPPPFQWLTISAVSASACADHGVVANAAACAQARERQPHEEEAVVVVSGATPAPAHEYTSGSVPPWRCAHDACGVSAGHSLTH